MSELDADRPEYLRLYFAAVSALPLPGERMTVAAYEKVRDLLWDDAKAREPKDGGAPEEKPGDGECPNLTAGSHLADSSRAGRTPHPDTTAGFGFGRRYGW